MSTREQILDVAQRLIRQRGYNGFSYADIAEEVGVRKASLHHHFPSKADLGLAIIQHYTSGLNQEFNRINSLNLSPDMKLDAYIAIYRGALEADCICLGGMLATELQTLDASLLPEIRRFFERNTEWLAEILTEGKLQRIFTFSESAADYARTLLAALQGAVLVARAINDVSAFERTALLLKSGLMRKG